MKSGWRSIACVALAFSSLIADGVFGQTFGNATRVDDVTGSVVKARFMTAFPQGWNIQKYSTRVEISWPYEDPESNQTHLKKPSMRVFRIGSEMTLQRDGFALLPVVIDSSTERKYVYYVGSRDEFLSRYEELKKDFTSGYPLRIRVVDDPTWLGYRKYSKYFRKKTAFDRDQEPSPTEPPEFDVHCFATRC